MPSKIVSRIASLLCAVVIAAASSPAFAKRSDKPPRTVAHSVVAKDYQRERLSTGEWKEETYTFGIGQMMDPTERDGSLTALSHEQMMLTLAEALFDENYVPAQDRDNIDLLIVINWGKTVPFNDGLKELSINQGTNAMNQISAIQAEIAPGDTPSPEQSSVIDQATGEFEQMMIMQGMADRSRHKANAYNAKLLGYAPSLFEYYSTPPVAGPQRSLMNDLENEVESERYFVILVAYDFKKLIKEKQKNIRWITRFSIRARGRKFDEELANMANAASSLFGVKSNRLKRNLLPGRISMGEVEMVETLEEDEVEQAKKGN